MIRLRISEDAFADLDEGYWFYEIQEAGLGDYFASSIKGEIEGLKVTAGIHRRDYHDYHRLVCRVFPYAVYYTFAESEVVVWAVVDCRRDPEWIRRHLGD
jgi:hypothetical protein